MQLTEVQTLDYGFVAGLNCLSLLIKLKMTYFISQNDADDVPSGTFRKQTPTGIRNPQRGVGSVSNAFLLKSSSF